MKNIFILIFTFFTLFAASNNVMAIEKQDTKIATVKQKGKSVAFTITSSKKFHVGGNVYVLRIGDNDFTLSEQSYKKGKGTITFFIPADDFKGLKDGENIYLNYGEFSDDDMEALAKNNPLRCQALGKFNKKLLAK